MERQFLKGKGSIAQLRCTGTLVTSREEYRLAVRESAQMVRGLIMAADQDVSLCGIADCPEIVRDGNGREKDEEENAQGEQLGCNPTA